MSFLDQTGLGTFWAKLKNYFVSKAEASAPVTGLTDILTPVNLVPNSNFMRGLAGASATMNIGTIPSGTSVAICDQWNFRVTQASLSNVIVTRTMSELNGSHSMRIQADVASIGSGDIYAGVLENARMLEPNGKSYTLYANYTNNSSSGINIGMIMNGSRTTVESNDHLAILRTANGSNRLNPLLQITGLSVGAHIDITLYDIYVYEGEFRNPPFTNSLDAQPANQFLLVDHSNFYIQRTLGTLNYVGRQRLLYLGKMSQRSTWFEGILHKSWSSEYWLAYYFKIIIYSGTITSTSASAITTMRPVFEFKSIGKASDATEKVPSAQLTYDSDLNLYLSLTTNTKLNSNFLLVPITWINFYNPVSSVPFYNINALENGVNTTDTVLKSVDTTAM